MYCSAVESSRNNKGMFSYKDHKSISVIVCDTKNIEKMNMMFDGCRDLKKLEFEKSFNTENVRNMRCMFEMCSSLTELDLKNFNTKNVTDMGYMFSKCSSLKKLNIRNFNTENVTDMSYMFYWCSKLKKINFGQNFNTTTNMYAMFDGCNKLAPEIKNKFSNKKEE